jgi:hypothetical protein
MVVLMMDLENGDDEDGKTKLSRTSHEDNVGYPSMVRKDAMHRIFI